MSMPPGNRNKLENLEPDAMRAISGYRLRLRLIAPDDAAYIYRLRIDSKYNTHLSAITGSVGDQRAWIERYKEREIAGDEYYYVIERLADRVPCGVIRLYDIQEGQFTWGSWILDESKPPKAALESAVLSFKLAFERLNMKVASIDVRRGNSHAIAFYRRFGMEETGEDGENLYFEYSRGRFEQDEDALRAAYER